MALLNSDGYGLETIGEAVQPVAASPLPWPIPNRRLSLRECAQYLGVSVRRCKEVAQDQQRKPQERQITHRTHKAYPQFQRYGNRWGCWGPRLQQWLEERG